MERRGFLKSLGILAVTACIPEPLEKAVEVIEKKAGPVSYKMNRGKLGLLVNHTTIQRKTVTITGSAKSEVLWYKFEDNTPEGYMWETVTAKGCKMPGGIINVKYE